MMGSRNSGSLSKRRLRGQRRLATRKYIRRRLRRPTIKLLIKVLRLDVILHESIPNGLMVGDWRSNIPSWWWQICSFGWDDEEGSEGENSCFGRPKAWPLCPGQPRVMDHFLYEPKKFKIIALHADLYKDSGLFWTIFSGMAMLASWVGQIVNGCGWDTTIKSQSLLINCTSVHAPNI